MSIGTHDLDTVEGPFTYEALPPDQIKFVPLNQVGSTRVRGCYYSAVTSYEECSKHSLMIKQPISVNSKVDCSCFYLANTL